MTTGYDISKNEVSEIRTLENDGRVIVKSEATKTDSTNFVVINTPGNEISKNEVPDSWEIMYMKPEATKTDSTKSDTE